jgi:hypothetical protein
MHSFALLLAIFLLADCPLMAIYVNVLRKSAVGTILINSSRRT